MAINFPFPASAGTKHTEAGLTWVYDGVKWTTESTPIDLPWTRDAATDTINPTNSGDDVTADNATFAGDATMTSQNGGQLAGFRNQIINGDFVINQRGFTTDTSSGAEVYTFDRWAVTGSAAKNVAAVSITNLPGFYNGIQRNVTTGPLSQAVELTQPGTNSQFPVGSVWTLSFYSTSATGVSVGDGFSNFRRGVTNTTDQVAFGNITSVTTENVGNGWFRNALTVTVTGDVSTSGSTLLCLSLTVSRTIDAVGTIYTGVQLEPGPVATPFEHRPIGTELALCQRYYYSLQGVTDEMHLNKATSTSTARYYKLTFPTTMRTTCTVNVTGSITGGTMDGAFPGTKSCRFSGKATTAGSVMGIGSATFTAEL